MLPGKSNMMTIDRTRPPVIDVPDELADKPSLKGFLLGALENQRDSDMDWFGKQGSLRSYRDAWKRLYDEVLDEKTGWGKEDLKKRMDKVLIEEMEKYL